MGPATSACLDTGLSVAFPVVRRVAFPVVRDWGADFDGVSTPAYLWRFPSGPKGFHSQLISKAQI